MNDLAKLIPGLHVVSQTTELELPEVAPLQVVTQIPKKVEVSYQDKTETVMTWNPEKERFEVMIASGRNWKDDYNAVKELGFKYVSETHIWYTKTRKLALGLLRYADQAAKDKIGKRMLENAPPVIEWDQAECDRIKASQSTVEELEAWLKSYGWKNDRNEWYDPLDYLEVYDMFHAIYKQRERENKT